MPMNLGPVELLVILIMIVALVGGLVAILRKP
jgi:hypothetical protein